MENQSFLAYMKGVGNTLKVKSASYQGDKTVIHISIQWWQVIEVSSMG